MNKTQAIEILSKHYCAPYDGEIVIKTSGNLVEDIMNEDIMGQTMHKWGRNAVMDDNLISLATRYAN
jgi:hypothetical protein|tara:strand:+ start:508 stop:708 length:201 start_codon:yes stop_codon:yes gene_type:complete